MKYEMSERTKAQEKWAETEERMVDFSKVRVESEMTHLFIPMNVMQEIRWLLSKAGVSREDCYMRPWRKVLDHQVPEIADISDEQRNAEIEKYYGEEAEGIKLIPAVIISHFNVEDLLEALQNTLFGDRDPDYKEHCRKRSEELRKEYFDDEPGIHIMRRE